MKWYSGEIADAVTFSKSKGAVFVVYIEGTDEKSQKITDLINNGELGEKLEQDHFVAIKIIAGSTAHHQFSEIYKEPSVPSIYFIGQKGVPLDIITGNTNLDTVSAKVDDVLNRAGFSTGPVHSISASVLSENFLAHEQAGEGPRVDNNALNTSEESPPEDEPSPSETEVNKSSEDKPPAEQPSPSETLTEPAKEVNAESRNDKEVTTAEETKEDKEAKVDKEEVKVDKEEVKVDKESKEVKTTEKGTTDTKEETEAELSGEEKVRRAKELIDLIRKEKQKEEEENERLKELERRKMGQNVQQLKKWQEDQELKQLKEERDREKRENQMARDRVLAQIAQDRAERLARNQVTPPKAPEAPKAPSPPKLDSNITRLQFKLPDGTSVTQEFEVSDTLEYVVSFLRSNLNITLSSFNLATTFPRREYTSKDYPTTLLDLELVPNANLLVLPTNGGEVSTNSEPGIISILWWGIWSPIFSILGFFKNLVFGSGSRNTTRPPPNEPARRTPTTARTSTTKRKGVNDGTTVIKRQGNVHRLSDRKDDDDENNTWNGNSTQQM
ncbi:unnamed protein product [Diabrotica balteata]|uniref:UBX domain-containing protein 4 n=1 Tax=Diabrotica balteata TaxID=107213 RepID=A0A9N9XCY4_DIABA|nr:unnamed protein product [Diabrotica balteata]